MRPVVDIVDQLLTAGVNVTVYNGQLDLIVDTMGNSPSVLPSVQHWRQAVGASRSNDVPEGAVS